EDWDDKGRSSNARQCEREEDFLHLGILILVTGGSAEMDDLGAVIVGFNIGQAKVDLDRAKGRFPDHADAGRAAEGQIVLHAGAYARILRAGTDAGAAQGVQPAHGAEVGE